MFHNMNMSLALGSNIVVLVHGWMVLLDFDGAS